MSDDDQSPFEQAASMMGKTPAEVAGLDRVFAGLRELAVARLHLNIAAHECAGAFRNFADAWKQSEERFTRIEAQEIAQHPDLAEANVFLDGFYGS